MNRWQDISISDASLKAEFITRFFNGDYIDAFTIISNNPQLNTKAFVADTINQIATILLSLENNFQNGVIDYLSQQYSNFQNIIDNYNLKGNWSASTIYQIYNFVTYNNIDYLYINLTPSSGNLPTNTDYWVEINIQGEKGAPGLGVNLQYNWSATTPYNALDVVYYNNALWVARVANINKIPGSTEEWETLSGSIVSFYNDGDIEISNLSVDIEPVQDLHGYNNPWPAGGSAQLLPTYTQDKTQDGITLKVNDDGSVTLNGTATATIVFRAPASSWQWDGVEDCWLSGCPAGGSFQNSYSIRLGALDSSANYSVPDAGSGVRLSAQFGAEITNKALCFEIVVRSGTVCTNLTFKPMLNKGLSAQPFRPYENICPISGWDAVDIRANGVNLLPNDYDAYNIGFNYSYLSDVVKNGERARFIFVDKDTSVDISDCSIGFQTGVSQSQSTPTGYRWAISNGVVQSNTSNVSVRGVVCDGVMIYPKDQQIFDKLFSRFDIMVVLDSTASDYHPYSGNRYTVQLGQTVYGAKLTIAEDGSVTALIDEAGVDLGTLNWKCQAASSVFYVDVPGKKAGKPVICSIYKPSDEYGFNVLDYELSTGRANNYVYVKDPRYTDVASFKAAVAGQTLVYMLDIPITIQLDPVTISTIAGQTNNVWADAGDITVELDKKYWEEFIKFKLASIYTDYIEPSEDSLYNGLIWFEVFNPQNWSYLTNRNYTWNQINVNNDTWESVDRGDY